MIGKHKRAIEFPDKHHVVERMLWMPSSRLLVTSTLYSLQSTALIKWSLVQIKPAKILILIKILNNNYFQKSLKKGSNV